MIREPTPMVFRRPGAKLWAVKRRFVPLWLFNKMFVPIVRYRAIRWIFVRVYP